jgi:hypothetical protein
MKLFKGGGIRIRDEFAAKPDRAGGKRTGEFVDID